MPPSIPSQRLTIKQAIAYFDAAHGIRISRATFWRYFLPPEHNGMQHWGAELERRQPNVAVTFASSDLDRLARSYAAYRSGKPPWYDSVNSGEVLPPAVSPRDRLGQPKRRTKGHARLAVRHAVGSESEAAQGSRNAASAVPSSRRPTQRPRPA
jgi:hypothetical protein